jgi:transposase-like protein
LELLANLPPRDFVLRGLTIAPQLAHGEDSLGFGPALREVFPATRQPRGQVQQPADVCNKLPPRISPKAKADRHEIRPAALKQFGQFLTKYGAKSNQACVIPKKDRDALLTFYDFLVEHWRHLRPTNPIESTFATIRRRHRHTKGNGTRQASLVMMFQLTQSASSSGANSMPPL